MKKLIIVLFTAFYITSFGESDIFIKGTINSTLPTVEIVYNLPSEDVINYAVRLIWSEAGYEPVEGQIAVVQTVMNRVRINKTNFIHEIDRQGQIDGRYTKYWYNVPSDKWNELQEIAMKALVGRRIMPDNVYFWHNECTSTDKRHVRWAEGNNGENVWKRINNHTFCVTNKK